MNRRPFDYVLAALITIAIAVGGYYAVKIETHETRLAVAENNIGNIRQGLPDLAVIQRLIAEMALLNQRLGDFSERLRRIEDDRSDR